MPAPVSRATPGCAVSNENVSVDDKETPDGVVPRAGKDTLNQSFEVTVVVPKRVLPCEALAALVSWAVNRRRR